MARFPRIDSPCPYVDNLAAIMDGDVCRMCKRSVTDLSDMGDRQRQAFLKSCDGEVCVSYRLPVRAALAAALAVGAMAAPTLAAACEDLQELVIVAGGLRRPAKAQMIKVSLDQVQAPQLPVVYDEPQAQPATAPSAKAAAPAPVTPTADEHPAPVRTPAAP